VVAPRGCAGKERTKMQVLAQVARQSSIKKLRGCDGVHEMRTLLPGAHASPRGAQRPCTGATMTRDHIKIPKLPVPPAGWKLDWALARSAGCGRGNRLDAPAYRSIKNIAKVLKRLLGMIASRSCTGVACDRGTIAMPTSTLWRSTHP
jgi:hypothetical protein